MTDTELLLAVVVASGINTVTVLAGIAINNALLTRLRVHIDECVNRFDLRMDGSWFGDIDRRFDELNEFWLAELHQFENRVDARLTRFEKRYIRRPVSDQSRKFLIPPK